MINFFDTFMLLPEMDFLDEISFAKDNVTCKIYHVKDKDVTLQDIVEKEVVDVKLSHVIINVTPPIYKTFSENKNGYATFNIKYSDFYQKTQYLSLHFFESSNSFIKIILSSNNEAEIDKIIDEFRLFDPLGDKDKLYGFVKSGRNFYK